MSRHLVRGRQTPRIRHASRYGSCQGARGLEPVPSGAGPEARWGSPDVCTDDPRCEAWESGGAWSDRRVSADVRPQTPAVDGLPGDVRVDVRHAELDAGGKER